MGAVLIDRQSSSRAISAFKYPSMLFSITPYLAISFALSCHLSIFTSQSSIVGRVVCQILGRDDISTLQYYDIIIFQRHLVETIIIAKRTCKFDKMAIFHIIPVPEDLDFILLRLSLRSKLSLPWWQKAKIHRYHLGDII